MIEQNWSRLGVNSTLFDYYHSELVMLIEMEAVGGSNAAFHYLLVSW